MIRTLLSFLVLTLALDAAAAPLRRTIVLGRGDRLVYETSAPISIVSLRNAGPAPKRPLIRYEPEQYAQTITITGLAEGEVTLLVQDTTERLVEIVRVLVAPPAFQKIYRQTDAEWRSLAQEGVTVLAAPPRVVIGGTVFSPRAIERCVAAEAAQPAVVCAARLAPAALALGSECIPARASLELAPVAPGDDNSRWSGVVRISDVPVLALETENLQHLLDVAGTATRNLNGALAEWRDNATRGRRFPVTFSSRVSGDGYEIAGQWTAAQGSRGRPLLKLSTGDWPLNVSTDPSRALEWEVALLTDVFRLYTLGRSPVMTSPRRDSPLGRLYTTAVKLAGGNVSDWNCATSLTRGYVSLRWSTGTDPLQTLATAVPDDFLH